MIKSIYYKSSVKRLLLILSIVAFSVYTAYCAVSYNKLTITYKDVLVSSDYEKADYIQNNKSQLNIFKRLLFNKDKDLILNNCINELTTKYSNKNISEDAYTDYLEDFKKLGADKDKIEKIKATLPSIKSSNEMYNNAVNHINNEKFEEALKLLDNIPSYSPIHSKASNDKNIALEGFKRSLIKTSSDYASKEYYSQAISTLESIKKYAPLDAEFNAKIEEYKTLRADYIAKNSKSISTNAKAVLTLDDIASNLKESSSIENHINALGLSSKTPYLAWVSTNNQITYIFKGVKDSWQLVQQFQCSTGKPGHDTPKGVFSTNGDKDTWFFNPKYNDGAKYWVRINGDYLFHSLPFDKTQKNVTDSVLGEPRSHGCIRLSIENAKWVYDNLTKGSTVVVR